MGDGCGQVSLPQADGDCNWDIGCMLGWVATRRERNGTFIPFDGRSGKLEVNAKLIHNISAYDHIIAGIIPFFIDEEVNILDVD